MITEFPGTTILLLRLFTEAKLYERLTTAYSRLRFIRRGTYFLEELSGASKRFISTSGVS